MELNREQIIKALECCYDNDKSCLTCPFQATYTPCVNLNKNAIALIKELTKENEWLEDNLIKQSAENIMRLIDNKEIKADTVRKMQERLTKEFDRMHKNNFMTPEVRQWIIDQIAKEMLEDV